MQVLIHKKYLFLYIFYIQKNHNKDTKQQNNKFATFIKLFAKRSKDKIFYGKNKKNTVLTS